MEMKVLLRPKPLFTTPFNTLRLNEIPIKPFVSSSNVKKNSSL